MFDHRWLYSSAGWQWRGMDEYLIPDYEGSERGDFLCEGRRRCPTIGQILVAVPRARDASVDNLAFSKGSVLVLADIGDGRYAAIVLEYRDALAAARDNTRPFFGNAVDIADRYISVARGSAVPIIASFDCGRGQVQSC